MTKVVLPQERGPTPSWTASLVRRADGSVFCSSLAKPPSAGGAAEASPSKRHRRESPRAATVTDDAAVKRPKASMGRLVAADLYTMEGNAKFAQGLYQDAVQHYTQAVNTLPSSARALCDRSAALAQLGQLDDALRDAHEATQIDPGNAVAYERKARAFLLLCNFVESINAYTEGIAKCSQPSPALREGLAVAEAAYRLIGQCQEEVKAQRLQSALSVLDGLIAKVPELERRLPVLRTRTEIWNQLGLQCHTKGAFGEACEAYTTAVGFCTDEAGLWELLKTIYCNRATSYIKNGNLKAALEDCCRSIAVDPAFPVPYLRLARILEQLQQPEEAFCTLQQASQKLSDPTLQDELKRLQRLRDQVTAEDYYKLLGVSEGCDAKDVKAAYKKLALLWHPDKCAPEARELCNKVFKAISHAHTTLSSDELRVAYHRQREQAKGGPATSSARSASGGKAHGSPPPTRSHSHASHGPAADRRPRSSSCSASARAAPAKGRPSDAGAEEAAGKRFVPGSQGQAYGCGPTSSRHYWAYTGPSGPAPARHPHVRDSSPHLSPRLSPAGREPSPHSGRRISPHIVRDASPRVVRDSSPQVVREASPRVDASPLRCHSFRRPAANTTPPGQPVRTTSASGRHPGVAVNAQTYRVVVNRMRGPPGEDSWGREAHTSGSPRTT
eukprot:EG_transcript_4993